MSIVMKSYDPKTIEKTWQKKWETDQLYRTADEISGKENFYKLVEFPYPSGNLHMGHWYSFAVPDILARFKRMQGYNVMYPIGFDAFGLPAENAAIKNKVHPRDWTRQNINNMTNQLRTMGSMLDWSRVVDTSSPDYYRWTQWIFIQFFKKGLAYRDEVTVNWCPGCKTVLANEQVVTHSTGSGHVATCERCGHEVEQRQREQWLYKTTQYAQELLDGLDKVDWPEVTKTAQRNWIGKSEGSRITFKFSDDSRSLDVFTTRADTLFGVTFLVVSPEIAKNWLEDGWNPSSDIKEYISASLSNKRLERLEAAGEKTGIDSQVKAINPGTKKEIPIWIADYVISGYGTGAIMAVPAHDGRDFEFAKKFKLPIQKVIVPPSIATAVRNAEDVASGAKNALRIESDLYEGEGELVNSGSFNGIDTHKAKEMIADEFGIGSEVQYRLRDWILSRQRYWGTPIPVVHCPECDYQVVPEDQLPIELPDLDDFMPADDGKSPLAKAVDWVNTKCPKCGGDAQRETDTMDTFVDSSWYFIRYTDPKNAEEIASNEKKKIWLPVDLYTGGSEHNTMHLLYARFFTKALHDLGLIDFDEPFAIRRNHGTVLGPDGNKMSKSKGNVVDPDKEVEQYGADAVRMYLAFLGPYDKFLGPWDPSGITGLDRFLKRVWKLAQSEVATQKNDSLERDLNKAIKNIGEDISELHFNTAISELMILLNTLEKNTPSIQQWETFLKLLSPFAPHITEEIWKGLGHSKSVHLESWPEYDKSVLKEDTVSVAVQLNGKTKGIISVPVGSGEDDVSRMAQEKGSIKKHLTGEIRKTIFVKDKIINFVL